MNNKEYEGQFKMDYPSLTKYLQNKYGLPNGSYFINESCNTHNKSIKRISDGLYIHHIAEYHQDYPFANNLSTQVEAIKYPFEFQCPQYLCYCNAIEHIILHYLIHRLRAKQIVACDDGLVHYMFPEVKAWYVSSGECIVQDWKLNAWLQIKNDEDSFIEIYNSFYKEFPNEPRYSYREYLTAQTKNKLKRGR